MNPLMQLSDPDKVSGFIQVANDGIEAIKFLRIKILNPTDFYNLITRFFFNFAITVILIRFLYYPHSKRKDYFFIFMIFSTVVFLLCFLLGKVSVQMGFALGLFAIFGILRYRTDTIPIKEMTYLFLMVGTAVINSLSDKTVSWAELFLANFLIVMITWYLERIWMQKREGFMDIRYEKIELIHPSRRAELMEDIKKRTGLNVYRLNIDRINFMRDTAKVRIFYREDKEESTLKDDTDEKKSDQVI
jgi:hypothetical protein